MIEGNHSKPNKIYVFPFNVSRESDYIKAEGLSCIQTLDQATNASVLKV